MRRFAPLLALCCAATCERRAEERVVVAAQEEAHASSTAAVAVEREQREVRGPVEVVTTTEEYGTCDPLSCPDQGVEAPDAGSPPVRVLKRRVVRVERRDPVTRETRVEARADERVEVAVQATSSASGVAQVETDMTAGPPAWAWVLTPALVLLVLAGGMWLKQRLGG